MSSGVTGIDLEQILSQPESLLAAWRGELRNSSLRLPGEERLDEMQAAIRPIVQAFSDCVRPDRAGRTQAIEFRAGAPELRDVERTTAFAGASMGADRFSGFDVLASLFALRDAVLALSAPNPAWGRYVEWLAAIASDAMATGREQSASERLQIELDEGTPLVMVTPTLPALLLVATPSRGVLSALLGRLLLTIVRTGARAAIVDASGLAKSSRDAFLERFADFSSNPRVAGQVRICVCGISEFAVEDGADLLFVDDFQEAVRSASDRGGFRLPTV